MADTGLTPNGARFIAPRQIAATIAKQKEFAVRSQMLMNVPDHWQPLVRRYLEIRMMKIRHEQHKFD